uniref:Uncharacterized protein n=1 Tax=Setaria italica TaxID=4555 RepID=K3Y4K4_SETIT
MMRRATVCVATMISSTLIDGKEYIYNSSYVVLHPPHL